MSPVLAGKFLGGHTCLMHISVLPPTTELGTEQAPSQCVLDE